MVTKTLYFRTSDVGVTGSDVTGDQGSPSVAALTGGGWYALWDTNGFPANGPEIGISVLENSGAVRAGPTMADTTSTGAQYDSDVAGLSNGNALAVWTDESGGAGNFAIRGRIFAPTGAAASTDDFNVSSGLTGNQTNADVAALSSNNRSAVVWVDDEGATDTIRTQIVTNTGTFVGVPIDVASGHISSDPHVVGLAGSGNFVVTWSQDAAGGETEIYARRFDNNGAALGAAMLLDTAGTSLTQPHIVALTDKASNGGFGLVYTSNGYGTGSSEITFSRYNATGTLLSTTMANVGVTDGNQSAPALAQLADGSFVVGWQNDAANPVDRTIDLARFDSTGKFYYNQDGISASHGDQVALTRIGGVSKTEFAIAWTSREVDSDGNEVRGAVVADGRTWVSDETGENIFTGDTSGLPGLVDIIYGNGGNDTIDAGNNDDQVFGGNGDDRIFDDATIGGDFYDGGDGTDTISYTYGGLGGTFDLLAGTATSSSGKVEQFLNFENFIGTDLADFIYGTDGPNHLEGAIGKDYIDGRGGFDIAEYTYSIGSKISISWGGNASNFQFATGSLTNLDTLVNIEQIYIHAFALENHSLDGVYDPVALTRYYDAPISGINAFGSDAAAGGWSSNNIYLRTTGDVNGDGREDVIGFGSDYTYVSLGFGNGSFANPIVGINGFGTSLASGGWANNAVYHREIADVNGDGRDDIVGFGSDYTYVSLGQANGTFANPIIGIDGFGTSNASGGWINDNIYPREMADVNGDGRADIVAFGSDYTYVSLGQANGTFGNPFIAFVGYGLSAAGGGWASQDLYTRRLGDVNGDGRADIVAFGSDQVYISLANANGTFANPVAVGSAFSVSDGWTSDTNFHRELADLNADGRADIVGFAPDGTFGALAKPGGLGFSAVANMSDKFLAGNAYPSNDGAPHTLGDLDNDGRADIIGFAPSGVFTAINTTDYFVI